MQCSNERKKVGVVRWALVAMVAVLFAVAGCSDEEPNRSKKPAEPDCTADAQCGDGQICDDEICVPGCTAEGQTCPEGQVCDEGGRCMDEPVVGECTNDGECDSAVAPWCEDGEVVSQVGACDTETDGGTCTYAEERIGCDAGCTDGACDAEIDLCAGVVCNTPPSQQCNDGSTLILFAETGECQENGECLYGTITETCVHGCEDDACVVGTCDGVVCEEPPAGRCENNVAITYNEEGFCAEDDEGAASCRYSMNFDDCSYTGATCNEDQGVCEGGVTQQGSVVIVEYMVNPTGIWAGVGEWFEIVNVSGQPIDLTGWKIRSGGVDEDEEHVIVDPPSFPAGARILFANSTNPGQDDSVSPDYTYSRFDIILQNSGDWLTLVNPQDEVVDYVYWERSALMPGHSRQLDPAAATTALANDNFANWCPNLTETYGVGAQNYGTPRSDNTACHDDPCSAFTCVRPTAYCNADGNAVGPTLDQATCQVSRFNNPYCNFEVTTTECVAGEETCLDGACIALPSNLPEPGEVVFTEFMGDPVVLNDAVAEWIEVYNRSDRELSLFTLFINDNETGGSFDSYRIVDADVTIAPGAYKVFVRDVDPDINGGIIGGVYYTGSHLKNSPGPGMRLLLVRDDGVVINEAHYGSPVPGYSQQLDVGVYTGETFDPEASLLADNWCQGAGVYGSSVNEGTPGVANVACQ